MSVQALAALAVFAFVTSVTPGPSNLMLLASGANFGFVRTLPQVFGITVGFGGLLAGVGLGLGAVLTAVPGLHLALKLAGAAYLLRLAWRIASARPASVGAAGAGRPLGFLESAAFQWVNPKAWVVALSTMAVYTDAGAPLASAAATVVVFALVNLPSVAVWAGFGSALGGLLADPRRARAFNVGMGLLLAATLWPMLAP